MDYLKLRRDIEKMDQEEIADLLRIINTELLEREEVMGTEMRKQIKLLVSIL